MAWLEQIISCNWLNAATSGQVINYLIDPLSNPEVQKRGFAVNYIYIYIYTLAGSFTDRLQKSSKNIVKSPSQLQAVSFNTALQIITVFKVLSILVLHHRVTYFFRFLFKHDMCNKICE